VVFAIGDREYTARDAVDAAWVTGELESRWSALLRAIACEEAAVERGLQADSEWLQSASEEFRYGLDLLTVEEIERWLEARQITNQEFNEYFLRLYWHEHLEEPPEPESIPYHSAGPLRELLRVNLWLSGEFKAVVRALAWRLLAGEEVQADAASVGAERVQFSERSGLQGADIKTAIEGLGREEPWLEHHFSLEAAYQRMRQGLGSVERLQRGLAQMRLPLTRVEFETVCLPSEDAAREAILCLRGNELSVSELAAECGEEPGRHSLLLDDSPEDTQQRLICAIPGDVFGPEQIENGFMIYRLVKKADPSLEDPDTRARLERRLLEGHFSAPTSQKVRWLIPGVA